MRTDRWLITMMTLISIVSCNYQIKHNYLPSPKLFYNHLQTRSGLFISDYRARWTIIARAASTARSLMAQPAFIIIIIINDAAVCLCAAA
jgi:hypothetical protein